MVRPAGRNAPLRATFVVPRYGDEVVGGAEALCRDTARALAARGHEITVLTSTARDHPGWEPHYPSGTEIAQGVRIVRHDAERPDTARAVRLARRLGLAPGGRELESAWSRAQGPVVPGLLRELPRHSAAGAASVFWTSIYATTQMGLMMTTGPRAVVPLAHEEPMLRFGLTRAALQVADGLAFMTPEEERLVNELHAPPGISAIVGAGLDETEPGSAAAVRRFRLRSRFALYLGRIEEEKGVGRLLRDHARYREGGGALDLVLAGRGSIRDAVPSGVHHVGYVQLAERADLLAAAEVVILPSRSESLSLVALEAWRAATPTLADAACAPVAGQTARSGGGLLYSPSTYARQLNRLAGDAPLRERLGASGAAWARDLTWDACAGRWEGLLERLSAGAGSGTRSAGRRPGGRTPASS